MKVFKVELMIIDFDELGEQAIIDVLENTKYPNRAVTPSVKHIESREVEWSDEHPLNKFTGQNKAYEELFASA